MIPPQFPEPATWYFGPTASIVFVYVVPVIFAGGFALRFFMKSLLEARHARDARRAADAESQTLDVGDTILRGRAELEDPNGAVRVTVEQEGSESESSGSWTVKWTELRRRIFVAPFYVVHASGERVRVEPGTKTQLAAELVGVERVDDKHRRRIAEVKDGQEVWITGELVKGHDPRAAGGYRGAHGWVMRPARDGAMRVAIELPEAAFRRAASYARIWTVAFALLFVTMMASHLQYHALVTSGRPVLATIVDKRVVSGDDSDSYEIHFETSSGGATLTDHVTVSIRTYDEWAPGNPFPAFATFGEFANAEPGDAARAVVFPTLAELIVGLVMAIVALVRRPREWHEGARVDESHTGRL